MMGEICNMKLRTAITGDMTLSVLDETGFKVLGVDMLRGNAMQAGADGERLARALNDLTLLSDAATVDAMRSVELPHPEVGVSDRPWRLEEDRHRNLRIRLKSATGQIIAERTFPASTQLDASIAYTCAVKRAVVRINSDVVMVAGDVMNRSTIERRAQP
jgi:hypothetical protein